MKSSKFMIIFLLINIIIFSQTTNVLANNNYFEDIDDHWSKEYVIDLYENSITRGYPDNTFRPENNISKIETIIMISNILGYDPDEYGEIYIKEYSELFDNYNVNKEITGYLGFAIEHKILKESEIKGMFEDGNNKEAKRYEVAIFIGRALEEIQGKTVNRVYNLSYNDRRDIPMEAMGYVDLLVANGILDEESNDNNFLPQNSIKRGEIAKIISITNEIIDDENKEGLNESIIERLIEEGYNQEDENKDEKDEESEVNKEDFRSEGFVTNIVTGQNRQVLEITTIDNKVLLYDISTRVRVSEDIFNRKLEDINKGDYVIVSGIDAEVNQIIIKEQEMSLVGYYKGNRDIYNRWIIYYVDEDGKDNHLEVRKDIDVYHEGKESSLDNISTLDQIYILKIEDEIVNIQHKDRFQKRTGILLKKESGMIVIKGEEDEERLYYEDEDDIRIVRNNRVIELKDLKIDDLVEVKLEYGKIVEIKAKHNIVNIEGSINSIIISNDIIMNLELENGEINEYIISDDVTLLIENDGFYDDNIIAHLNTRDAVNLRLVNGKVDHIVVKEYSRSFREEGRVRTVNTSEEYIIIEILEGGIVVEEKKINYNRSTRFLDDRDRRVNANTLDRGDVILIRGNINRRGDYLGESIIILERSN